MEKGNLRVALDYIFYTYFTEKNKGARGVMVIVIRNGHGGTSSRLYGDWITNFLKNKINTKIKLIQK